MSDLQNGNPGSLRIEGGDSSAGMYIFAFAVVVLLFWLIISNSGPTVNIVSVSDCDDDRETKIKWGETERIEQPRREAFTPTGNNSEVKTKSMVEINPEAELSQSILEDADGPGAPEFDYESVVMRENISQEQLAAQRKYNQVAKPMMGTLLSQNVTIFEPPPQKYYSTFRRPHKKTMAGVDRLQVSGVDDSENYTSWSTDYS